VAAKQTGCGKGELSDLPALGYADTSWPIWHGRVMPLPYNASWPIWHGTVMPVPYKHW